MSKYSSDSDSSLHRRSKRSRRSRSSSSSSSSSYRRKHSSKKSSKHYNPSSRRKKSSRHYSRRRSRSHERSSKRSRSKSREKYKRRSHSRDRYKSKSYSSHSKGYNSKPSRSSSVDSTSSSIASSSRSSKASYKSQGPPLPRAESSEELRDKLLKAIKAAESADYLLKEQGVLAKGVTSRNEFNIKTNSKPDADVLQDINDDSFAPKSFSSSKVKENEVAETQYTPECTDQRTIFHASLYADPKLKMERWVRKLYQIRQRALTGEATVS